MKQHIAWVLATFQNAYVCIYDILFDLEAFCHFVLMTVGAFRSAPNYVLKYFKFIVLIIYWSLSVLDGKQLSAKRIAEKMIWG